MDSSVGVTLLIIGLLIVAVSIFLIIFWILMMIHVLTKNSSEQQILWIALMVVFGPIASIVYYFSVKRPMDAKPVAGVTSFK